MSELYPNVPKVQSEILDQDIQQPANPVSTDAILVLGTALQGNLYDPVRLGANDIEDVFGNVPDSDPYSHTSLVKGFKEVEAAAAGTTLEVVGVRIGEAKKGKLELYEHTYVSGAISPSSGLTDFGPALTITAIDEGTDAQDGILVDVSGDDQGRPTLMDITLPNGSTVSFNLDILGNVGYSRVSRLAAAINADAEASQYLSASPGLLSHTKDITIISGTISGTIETQYELDGGTWADKPVDLRRVYTSSLYTDEDSVEAGLSTATLEQTPDKDTDPNTTTISKFWSKVISGLQVTGDALNEGSTTFNLVEIDNNPYWKSGESDSIQSFVLKRSRAGITATLEEGVDYTISGKTVTLIGGNTVENGDKYYATYNFLTQFTEANVRSELQKGNRYSYFVIGDRIVFGAAQQYPLILAYVGKVNYSVGGDVGLVANSEDKSIIEFRNPANYPSIGDTVSVEFIFEAELPAPNVAPAGSSVPTSASGKINSRQLSGGDDGRHMTNAQLYAAVQKGLVAADNTPCRYVVVQGIYLDDVMEGYNEETGLLENQNAGFATLLSSFLRRHSQYVSECEGFIGVAPLRQSGNRPTIEQKLEWYDKLVNVSTTDTTRAANIMAAIDDYHISVPVGDLVMITDGVYNGRPYIGYAPNTYAGMRYAHDNLSAMTNKRIPRVNVQRIVYPVTAMDKVNAILGARYTLIAPNSQIEGSPLVVVGAPTAARTTSKYRRQYNVAIVFEAVNRVRRALQPFIGKANSARVRQAMDATARSVLKEMTPNMLLSFDVAITATQGDAINGRCKVGLNLTTAVEIETINVQTRLTLSFA